MGGIVATATIPPTRRPPVPELPEVETIRRTLEPHVVGRTITAAEIHHPHVTSPLAPRAFVRAVLGRTVARSWRKGKYMVFDLTAGDDHVEGLLHMIIHLRMTGRLCYLARGVRWSEDSAHTHATLRLEGGGRLIFHDVRKFGRLTLAAPPELPAHLPAGRDPVIEGLDAESLRATLAGRTQRLKALLLRQDLLTGLGNIYADEALHRAGLHPEGSPADLRDDDWPRLAEGIRAVLHEALAFRGTTLLDYRTGDGDRGAFAQYLRVYGRAGAPCRACGTPIAAIQVAGRTTAFCPACQPAPPHHPL